MSDTPFTDEYQEKIKNFQAQAQRQERLLAILRDDLLKCIEERDHYKGLVFQIKAVLDTYAGRGAVADK